MSQVATAEGFVQLGKQLRKLETKLGAKIIRKAVRITFKPVIKSAKRMADLPDGSGRLSASIGQKNLSRVRKGIFTSLVGVRRDFKWKDKEGNKKVTGQGKFREKALAKGFSGDVKSAQMYARPIHKGTFATGMTARRKGAVPFLDEAVEMQDSQIINNFARELDKGISQLI